MLSGSWLFYHIFIYFYEIQTIRNSSSCTIVEWFSSNVRKNVLTWNMNYSACAKERVLQHTTRAYEIQRIIILCVTVEGIATKQINIDVLHEIDTTKCTTILYISSFLLKCKYVRMLIAQTLFCSWDKNKKYEWMSLGKFKKVMYSHYPSFTAKP